MKQPELPVSKWPRGTKYMGIAHGWPGAFWVALQLDRTGLMPMKPRTIAAVRLRLRRPMHVRVANQICSSSLIGSGAFSVIAAAAAEKIPQSLFNRTLRFWMHDANETDKADLMMGSAGALLASAEIERSFSGKLSRRFIKKMHNKTAKALEQSLSVISIGKPVFLGLSHGLAGYLLALETGKAVFGLKFNASLRTKCVDAIWEHRLSIGKNAALWPEASGGTEVHFHSWCHGAPGIALAFLCAHQLTGIDAYWQIAQDALAATFRVGTTLKNFCCGSTGRAQILLEAFRFTKDESWLKKANEVADQIPFSKLRHNHSFHAGTLGYRYLRWRLKHPELLPLPGLGIFSL